MHGVEYEAESQIDAINIPHHEDEDVEDESEISSPVDILASNRR